MQHYFTGIFFLELNKKTWFLIQTSASSTISSYFESNLSSLEKKALVCYCVPGILVPVRQSMCNKSK